LHVIRQKYKGKHSCLVFYSGRHCCETYDVSGKLDSHTSYGPDPVTIKVKLKPIDRVTVPKRKDLDVREKFHHAPKEGDFSVAILQPLPILPLNPVRASPLPVQSGANTHFVSEEPLPFEIHSKAHLTILCLLVINKSSGRVIPIPDW
jgi:hypothetical protein